MILSRRALNRATLARQLLLERSPPGVAGAVEAVAGLNAQHVEDPYFALHSRLGSFALNDLTTAIEAGIIVRSCLLRGTQHLVSAVDLRWLQPVLQPLLARLQRNTFGRRTEGVDLTVLAREGRAALAGRTLRRPELADILAHAHPGADRTALAWSLQYLVPQVHPAPTGTWGSVGAVHVALAEDMVGPLDPPDPRRLVRRYLAAFGPATTTDMRAWSGVGGLHEVVAGMEGELRTFHDPEGRRLYDLPDAPRPDGGTPAPVRLIAGFDNILLGYADRTRIMSDEARRRICEGDLVRPALLVDGEVAGTWQLDRAAGRLTIEGFSPLPQADIDAAIAEGHSLLALAHADTGPRDVRYVPS